MTYALKNGEDQPLAATGGSASAHWVWVFGEIDGLRWVLERDRMAFADHDGSRAGRVSEGDRAILYVTRGAHHNPTRDRARFRGVVTATSGCSEGDPLEIAGREFSWTCRIQQDLVLPGALRAQC